MQDGRGPYFLAQSGPFYGTKKTQRKEAVSPPMQGPAGVANMKRRKQQNQTVTQNLKRLPPAGPSANGSSAKQSMATRVANAKISYHD